MGKNIYLEKLNEKCKNSNKVILIAEKLLNTLHEFGYISYSKLLFLSKRLYENIDSIKIGNEGPNIDFKTGYYDAITKELYIKDINNISSIYLRLLYAMCTRKDLNDNYIIGYSNTEFSNIFGKTYPKNFGINRAIMSNLVCRLLNTTPTTLSIVPTYRTYANNFLGKEIEANNDIYFLEGKVLSQICSLLNIKEEELYLKLFSKRPLSYFQKVSDKISFVNFEKILEEFDNLSTSYSNYNKLCYFSNMLNNNYIEIRKNNLKKNTDELLKKEKDIKLKIRSILEKLNPEIDTEDNSYEVEIGLSEEISNLENSVLNYIVSIQNKLIDYLIYEKKGIKSLEYAKILKSTKDLLIIQNENLEKELFDTIYNHLITTSENTATNLIQLIKYSLTNKLLSDKKVSNYINKLFFRFLPDLDNDKSTEFIITFIDNEIINLIEVTNTLDDINSLKNNVKIIDLHNLQYIQSQEVLKAGVNKAEYIYTKIKELYPEDFKNIFLKDMLIGTIQNSELIIVPTKNDILVYNIKLNKTFTKFSADKIVLSELYKLITNNQYKGSSNNLPAVIVQTKPSLFKRLFGF